MRIKLSNLHHNIPLSSKLVNYKTEDICDVLLFDDNFDIYINENSIKILSYSKSTKLKTKVLCEVSKNSDDDFDKKIYNDIVLGMLSNDIKLIIESTKDWILEALTCVDTV